MGRGGGRDAAGAWLGAEGPSEGSSVSVGIIPADSDPGMG